MGLHQHRALFHLPPNMLATMVGLDAEVADPGRRGITPAVMAGLVVVEVRAEGMQEQAMADSVVAAAVVNQGQLAQMPSLAMAVLAAVVVGRWVRINKAQPAPLLWLSSGEVSRHEIRIPE